MRIDRIELRLLRLPLVQYFETSFGRIDARAFILARVEDSGVAGHGECVAAEDPYYSAETVETAWHVMEGFLVRRLLGVAFDHPRRVFAAFGAVRGHPMAKAALEMAAWDLYARRIGQPLARVLGGTRTAIASGVSIGIRATLEELAEAVATELRAGYRRIKIKIRPGWDLEPVRFLRDRFGDVPLMVDANAAYTMADADHLGRLDEFDLLMIEQPLSYDDTREHARLQRRLRTPICLDESVDSVARARDALDEGACRIINIKPGRVGGHAESIRLHDLCASRGVPNWHGGMLESGIGRAHNIHLASLDNFSLPGDIAASRRYFSPDLIDPAIDVSPDGTIPVPTGPGLGVSVCEDRIENATERRLVRTA